LFHQAFSDQANSFALHNLQVLLHLNKFIKKDITMHVYIINHEPSETWNYEDASWLRWMESAPVSPPPRDLFATGGTELSMKFDWVDQGFGYRKGWFKIQLMSTKNEVLATEYTATQAEHIWTTYDVKFTEKSELLNKMVDGSYYRISIYVGDGGGHELTIKSFTLQIYFEELHERSYSNTELVKALSQVQATNTDLGLQNDKGWSRDIRIGMVVIDVIYLAIGGVGLRKATSKETAAKVVESVAPAIPKFRMYIEAIAKEGATTREKATACFKILHTIWSGGFGGAAIGAILHTLSWYQGMCYGITAFATILAASMTDGAAFVGEVLLEVANFAFLVDDSYQAVLLSE